MQRHRGIRDVQGVEWLASMPQVAAWLRAEGQLIQPVKLSQELICLDNGRDCRKCRADVYARWGLFMDHDRCAPSLKEYERLGKYLGIAYAAHESWSSTPAALRVHGIIAMAQPIATDEQNIDALRYEQAFIMGVFAELLCADLDTSSGTPGRAIFAGNRPSATAAARQVVGAEGGGLDHAKVLQLFGYAPTEGAKGKGNRTTQAEHAARVAAALGMVHKYQDEAKRKRRFLRYLEKCQPTKPGMLPHGASAQILGILKTGMCSLLLPREWVVNILVESDWNARGTDAGGVRPWPWSRQSIEIKANCIERTTELRFYGIFCGVNLDEQSDESAASGVSHV